MNPWWQNFLKRMDREHDINCVDGQNCTDRAEHILRTYVPSELRAVIDRHPEAQADAVRGEPKIVGEPGPELRRMGGGERVYKPGEKP